MIFVGGNKFKTSKSPKYKVVEVEKINKNPPPEFCVIYQLEHIQSGKKIETEYTSFKDAEKECESKNELDTSPS